ncbi:MAG TPA: alpha/beta hydrolase [Pyrinomonadaceae bacterium]|nr:alpha/beta hydrolase [Pyrinomonadaceae bacterium]
MKQIQILLLSVLISMATAGQEAASQSVPADLVYARPGQLVDAGGFRLNLYCMGSGSPTVVFDSGWGDWAPAWSKVQRPIAKWTRACSYDRAGTGFSEPGPMPRTSVRIAHELHTALHNAGIAGPYILVASAFGADNMRVFADRYMGEVAGLVMVDGDPNDLEPKAMQEESHRGQAAIPSDLRACRDLIAAHKPLPALPSRPGRPQQTCAQRFFYRGLPEAEWSPELNAKLLEIAQTKVAMYDAYASEMEQTPFDEAWLQQHHRSFGSRPIRVLTSGNHGVGHLERKPPDTPEHLKYEQETTLAQARWLKLSSNAKQIFVRNSSEYIQFDQPDAVVKAVREIYDQSNSRRRSTKGADPQLGSAANQRFAIGYVGWRTDLRTLNSYKCSRPFPKRTRPSKQES